MREYELSAAGQTSVDQFAMGYWVIGLSVGISILGAVVGLACLVHAGRSARFRLIWLASAAVSIGGIGIWLSTSLAMLGLAIPGSPVRYAPLNLVLAMLASPLVTFAALLLVGRTFRPPFLLAGGLVMGLGIGLTHFLGVEAVHVQGAVRVSVWLAIAATVIGVVTAVATLWSFHTQRSVLARAITVVLFGLGVAATFYTALAGLQFDVDRAAKAPTGIELFDFVFPTFVLGSMALAVPISAVLIAPDRREIAALEGTRATKMEPAL
ncbi:MHYT domain-containing protein [Nocardia callitridis]|uniref:MHYT domain-containing protein n=1 Tax=Nocardia callitridis TaxID=648753 RepID=A0ABP9JSL5_9NOCA